MASPNLQQKIRLLFYYSMLWIVGFLAAFWFGLGWFFLFHTLRHILLTSPKLYLSTIKFVVGPDFAEYERNRFQGKENYWFFSKISLVVHNPEQGAQGFRGKAHSDSGACRTLIPG